MSSSSSSSSASKKELLGAAAGEFASTLFERLKKSAERKNNTNNNANSPSPHSGASTSSTTANVISNLAQNLLADNSGGSGGGISFSKLLNDQLNKNKSNTTTQVVKIYDDDDLDDDNFDVAKMPDMTVKKSQQQQSAVPTSKSEMNMNALINKSNDSTNSSTNSTSESASSSKMSTSSSLHRLGSVLDDILKSDLANSMVDTAAREAESLRRGILTKKKSIELSLESMKSRTRSSSKLINSPDSDHATATSTPTSATEAIATDSTTPSSLLITTDEDQESDNKKQLPESTATSTATTANNTNKSESSKKDDDMSNTTKTTENQNQTESVNLDDSKIAETRSSQQSSNVDETSSNLESESNKTKPVKNDQTQNSMLLSDKRLIGGTIAVAVVFGLILGKNLSFVVLSFLFGITFGAVLTASILYLAYKYDLIKYIIKPTPNNSIDNRVESVNSAESTSSQLQSLLIQTAIKKENKNFDGVYRGWMNELREVYDPENYFLNKTRSVYLNLDGVVLRIQTTTSRIPKRAVAGENIGTVQFNEQRHYDLTDCEVVILPTRLCRKRYWSKKYPICLKGVKLLGTKGGITTTASSSSLQQTETQSNTSTSAAAASNNSSNLLREESTTSSSELDMNTLVLFGRTDREKEEWFNLFCKASAQKLNDSMYYLKMKRSKQTPSPPIARPVSLNEKIGLSFDVSNNKIIYKMLDEEPTTSKESKENSKENKENTDQPSESSSSSTNHLAKEIQTDTGLLYDTSLALFNTFVIRMFTDVFTHHDIIERIQSKIQNKLSKIDVPYFMEELRVTGLDLGSVVPLVKQTTEPWYDERGLWVHMDIDYSGGLQLSLSTKLNLMKLKSNTTHHHHLHQLPPQQSSTHQHQQQPSTPTNAISTSSSVPVFTFKNDTSSLDDAVLTSNLETRFSPAESMSSLSSSPGDTGLIGLQQTDAENNSSKGKKKRSGSVGHHIASKTQRKKTLGAYDSNEEDSPESSGDEYVHTGFLDEENKLVETANASKKLLGFVTKIASSDYFQKATENKYIKKAMENVSNCQLLLNVELKKIVGTIALNIPPHPSDRIWYGFVSSPQMVLVATPQVGEKEVSYSAITDWIADKLKQEFQKVLVFPNMDDFYIPIMKSELEFKNK